MELARDVHEEWLRTPDLSRDTSYDEFRKRFRWNLPTTFNIGVDTSDKHAVDKGKLAIIYDKGDGTHEKWTYWELAMSSNRLANALCGLGCIQGDRVGIFLSQSPELVVSHIATYKMGGIAVPLFTLFGPEALVHRLNDAGARAIVTDKVHLERILDVREDLTALEFVVVTDAEKSWNAGRLRIYAWADLMAKSSARFQPVETTPEDPAVIIYTSGTTGPAKGALHGHRVLLGHLPGVSLPHDFMPHQGDLFWTPADWAWIGGLFDVLFPALHWGLPVLAQRMAKFNPDDAFHLMERWGVRNVFLPPTSLKMMRQIENPRSQWNLNLRSIASGGESLGEETLAWARENLGVSINEFYGQTECNVVLGNCSKLFPAKPNSMGRPIPGHDVTVIDAEGQPVKAGIIGEIAVRNPDPVMFLEYWKRPDATKGKFVNGWMRTGDLGYVNDEGYFHFVGRSDDIISSAGYRIGPVEVEEVLVKHPAVVMAAVVGSPDAVRGEIVKAFVQLRDGVSPTSELTLELQNWVKHQLGAHEYPREVEFVTEYPMTPSGKIQRNVLKWREYERKGKRAGVPPK